MKYKMIRKLVPQQLLLELISRKTSRQKLTIQYNLLWSMSTKSTEWHVLHVVLPSKEVWTQNSRVADLLKVASMWFYLCTKWRYRFTRRNRRNTTLHLRKLLMKLRSWVSMRRFWIPTNSIKEILRDPQGLTPKRIKLRRRSKHHLSKSLAWLVPPAVER